jgi:hypothetical protein
MTMNRRIVLASRPTGAAVEDNFRLDSVPVPVPAAGQVLVRHHYLSLDPYMRGRMNDGKSYAAPQAIGEPMIGGTVGEVVASHAPGFAVGDKVVGMGGWQEYSIATPGTATGVQKVDTSHIPLSAYLGVVGMPGVTAWYGLNRICEPKAGETVVVSAASGAVGGVVGQLAKARGCRAVGIAGGREKCDFVVKELGFDACVDYKAAPDFKSLRAMLREAAPNGIDCNFENVGGVVLDAILSLMNAFGRIAVCGMISRYDGATMPLADPSLILISRLKVQGFIVSEHMGVWPEALAELGAGVARGTLKYRESVAHGIESAPGAFLGLLKGRNFGKQVVKLV